MKFKVCEALLERMLPEWLSFVDFHHLHHQHVHHAHHQHRHQRNLRCAKHCWTLERMLPPSPGRNAPSCITLCRSHLIQIWIIIIIVMVMVLMMINDCTSQVSFDPGQDDIDDDQDPSLKSKIPETVCLLCFLYSSPVSMMNISNPKPIPWMTSNTESVSWYDCSRVYMMMLIAILVSFSLNDFPPRANPLTRLLLYSASWKTRQPGNFVNIFITIIIHHHHHHHHHHLTIIIITEKVSMQQTQWAAQHYTGNNQDV